MTKSDDAYRYPTDELITDALEQRQDQFKREREVAVLKAMTAFEWYYGLDFGCGTGRNIPLLTKVMKRLWQRHIFAVDPDAERLEIAKRATRKLADGYVHIEYLPVSGETLRLHLGSVLFDLVLCCQVFTHMSRAEVCRTLDLFKSVMEDDGTLVVCVPFHCLEMDGDYYHLIDISRSFHSGEVDRVTVSAEDFDRAAAAPAEGVLPVRAFGLKSPLPRVQVRDLPLAVEAPVAFAGLEHFSVVSCLVYSIHRYENGMPVIGDLAIKLHKRRH
jgi:SAM-dependent methyltransferase